MTCYAFAEPPPGPPGWKFWVGMAVFVILVLALMSTQGTWWFER